MDVCRCVLISPSRQKAAGLPEVLVVFIPPVSTSSRGNAGTSGTAASTQICGTSTLSTILSTTTRFPVHYIWCISTLNQQNRYVWYLNQQKQI
jgi:hypothetical protein